MDTFGEFWQVLNHAEDYLRGGEPRNHAQPPANPFKDSPAAVAAAGGSRRDQLDALTARVEGCRRCGLSQTRNRAVPGMGALDPLVMIVGEGPGAEEDKTGIPFVGPAGHYLDKWLAAINLDRNKNCFIGNVVKCRPPGNRDPEPAEQEACLPFLREQIALIRPRSLLTLGRCAAQALLGTTTGITRLRGRFYQFEGIPLVPTFHPSAVLRNQSLRQPVWDDLRLLRDWLQKEGLF